MKSEVHLHNHRNEFCPLLITVRGLKFYPACMLQISLPWSPGYWQMTQDSWVRNKGLYYSWHSKQFEHHVCMFLLLVSQIPWSHLPGEWLRWMLHIQWVGLIAEEPWAYETPVFSRELLVNLLILWLRDWHCLHYLEQEISLNVAPKESLSLEDVQKHKGPLENDLPTHSSWVTFWQ